MTTFPADNAPVESTIFIGSREKADNKYGQNGYHGPSSTVPGDKEVRIKGFGDAVAVPERTDNWQTRKVETSPYPTTHGMSAPRAPEKIPSANIRRASVSANPKSFQR